MAKVPGKRPPPDPNPPRQPAPAPSQPELPSSSFRHPGTLGRRRGCSSGPVGLATRGAEYRNQRKRATCMRGCVDPDHDHWGEGWLWWRMACPESVPVGDGLEPETCPEGNRGQLSDNWALLGLCLSLGNRGKASGQEVHALESIVSGENIARRFPTPPPAYQSRADQSYRWTVDTTDKAERRDEDDPRRVRGPLPLDFNSLQGIKNNDSSRPDRPLVSPRTPKYCRGPKSNASRCYVSKPEMCLLLRTRDTA